MSVQAMTWALSQQTVTEASMRHVLLCLANYAGPDGRGAFPSVATLCVDTGMSERTVRYKLDALLEAGVIVPGNPAIVAAHIGRGDRRPTVYDIVMERGASAAPRSQRGANGDSTGCKPEQDGVQMATERGAPAAPDPRTETKEEPSMNRRAACGSRLPDDWALPSSWGQWALEYHPTWTEEHVRRVADQFGDYWRSKAGKDARKADWGLAWKCWVRKEAALKAGATGAVGTSAGGAWWTTWAGIVARGAELGVVQGEREIAPAFKSRVLAAAGDGPWTDAQRPASATHGLANVGKKIGGGS